MQAGRLNSIFESCAARSPCDPFEVPRLPFGDRRLATRRLRTQEGETRLCLGDSSWRCGRVLCCGSKRKGCAGEGDSHEGKNENVFQADDTSYGICGGDGGGKRPECHRRRCGIGVQVPNALVSKVLRTIVVICAHVAAVQFGTSTTTVRRLRNPCRKTRWCDLLGPSSGHWARSARQWK